MLGPSVLVAPILEKGVEKREVYLPRGTWLDWWVKRSTNAKRGSQ
jgi:alpha-glucosidase (family GH31 glycosyl hydrolase)